MKNIRSAFVISLIAILIILLSVSITQPMDSEVEEQIKMLVKGFTDAFLISNLK